MNIYPADQLPQQYPSDPRAVHHHHAPCAPPQARVNWGPHPSRPVAAPVQNYPGVVMREEEGCWKRSWHWMVIVILSTGLGTLLVGPLLEARVLHFFTPIGGRCFSGPWSDWTGCTDPRFSYEQSVRVRNRELWGTSSFGANRCDRIETYQTSDCRQVRPTESTRSYDTCGASCSTLCQCGGNYSSTGGMLCSPGYPDRYDRYMYCDYHVTVPSGRRVALLITHMELEACCDHLSVYDGSDGIAKEMISGTGNNSLFLSSGNQMVLRFTSDSSFEMKGFHAIFFNVTKKGELMPSFKFI